MVGSVAPRQSSCCPVNLRWLVKSTSYKREMNLGNLEFWVKSPPTDPPMPTPAKPWTPTPKGKKSVLSHHTSCQQNIPLSVEKEKCNLEDFLDK